MEPDVKDIYRRLMLYMEGREKTPPSGVFAIPVTVNGNTKDLKFRRLAGLNNMTSVQSLDNEKIRIFYDPNWESLALIESLLGERP